MTASRKTGEAQLIELFTGFLSHYHTKTGPVNVYVMRGCQENGHSNCGSTTCILWHHYVIVYLSDIEVAVLLELDKENKGGQSCFNIEQWNCGRPATEDHGPVTSNLL